MEYVIPNLKNACKILEHMARDGRELTCLDVSRAMKLPRTSVLRIMETFAAESFLKKENGRYSLGPMLANLGDCALARTKLLSSAKKYLQRLTDSTGETSHFAVPSGHRVLIARVCESPLPLHAASREGALVEAYCSATGKAILAHLFAKDASILKKIKFHRRTKKTISDARSLQKELSDILKNGYAIDDEEYHEGVRCMAVPVFDKLGGIVGGIGITAPSIRFTRAKISKMYSLVHSAAEELSKSLDAGQ